MLENTILPAQIGLSEARRLAMSGRTVQKELRNVALEPDQYATMHYLNPKDDPHAAEHNAAHRSYESLSGQLEVLTKSAEEVVEVTTGKSVKLTYSQVAGDEVVRNLQVLRGNIYDTNRKLQPGHQYQHEV